MTNDQPISDIRRSAAAWATAVAKEIGASGVYLFGSLIYRGGAQFGQGSDIDLVVCFPKKAMDDVARRNWIENLLGLKVRLEAELAAILVSADPNKPLCSVVVPMPLDVEADIHKDGARGFFKENVFLNLLNSKEVKGLPGAGSREIKDRLAMEGMRFAQKKRNEFLAVNSEGVGGLAPYQGADPAPKDVMRNAAMAAHPRDPKADPGAEYDTQAGLDFLSNHLYRERADDPALRDLHDWLSVRRGARGAVGPLTPRDHLLFAEIICGAALGRLSQGAEEVPSLHGKHSTIWFNERFAQAFPGVRGVQWFEDAENIKTRLGKLLEQPLVYADSEPAWWFRGSSNMSIRALRHIRDRLYQMDEAELLVRRIAAVHSGQYYRDFVYVEVEGMAPVALYPSTEQRIAEERSGQGIFGYYWEEYGLVDGIDVVTRAQYDDGAAEIDGRLQDIRGRTELRLRYVTPYNFIVAANGSSINTSDFDEVLVEKLDAMLRGEDRIEELFKAVSKLPKRHH
jgi:predicted nucleotidyltransferase